MPAKKSPRAAAPRDASAPPPLPPGTPGFHKLRRVSIKGGFLDGFEAELDEHLNCVIGGHGTGKTTILEFLRFAFRGRPDKDTPLDRLVRKNLGSGQLTVELETRNGERYTILRTASGEPDVRGSQNRPVPFKLTPGTGPIFDLEVVSQGEIEAIATSTALQLQLIDRFALGEIREVEDKVEGVLNALRANAAELVDLSHRAASHERKTDELPGLEAQLAELPEVGGEAAQAIELELKRKTERGEEARALGRLTSLLEEEEPLLARARDPLQTLDTLLPESTLQGPNAPVFRELQGTLRAARELSVRGLSAVEDALRGLVGALRAAEKALGERHREQELGYQAVMAKDDEQRGLADERVDLERRIGELRERKQALLAHEAEDKRLTSIRQGLLDQLEQLREERSDVRDRVAKELTEALQPGITVTIARGENVSRFLQRLSAAAKEVAAGRHYTQLCEKAANLFNPAELVDLILRGDADAVATRLKLTADKVDVLMDLRSKRAALHEVDVIELGDEPVIALMVGGEPKVAEDLSTGQKATTILPILLLQSERPLLIDEPENHLDNSYIWNAVAPRIRQAKGKRQLLFVTHNPNLTVLAQAKVFVMHFVNKQGRKKVEGPVEKKEVREYVEEILEGGKDAFLERMRRYGY